MATKIYETPEAEASRMKAISAKKAALDAAVAAYEKQIQEAKNLGTQLPEAMKKAKEKEIADMGKELDELHWKTEVVPPNPVETRKCLNTGGHAYCPTQMPTRLNTRCDLCQNVNNKL